MIAQTASPTQKPVAGQRMTIEELSRLPKDGTKYELIAGKVVMTPAGLRHEEIGGNLFYALKQYLEQHPVGRVYGSSAGFELAGDVLLSPDVSVVRAERLSEGKSPEGYADFAPDLAVEVVSPNDRQIDIEEKVHLYLQHGTHLVWIIHPRLRSATVYHPDGTARLLGSNDSLSGEDVLPGLACRLADLV